MEHRQVLLSFFKELDEYMIQTSNKLLYAEIESKKHLKKEMCELHD